MDTCEQTSVLKAIALGVVMMAGGLSLASAIEPSDAINLANKDMVHWMELGSCGYAGTLITHQIPLAWVETSTGGAPFLSGVSEGPERKSGLLRLSGLDSTAESRVFLFTESLWQNSEIAQEHDQQVCSIASASAPSLSSSSGNSGCRAESQNSSTGFSITEAYDSRKDAGWTSGCRDDDIVKKNMASNLRCNTSNMSSSLITNTSDSQNSCIGNWGSLHPRQSREIGLTGAAASAKTAFRAMSTARDHFGSVPFPVDSFGMMQQSMPSKSPGFFPGSLPLYGTKNPENKHFAWIYWRTVVCCI